MATLTIGALSTKIGCKVQTIRYYEDIGLLPPPERSSGNHRLYGPSHEKRLAFIRHSRELGFSIDQIRSLLSLSDNHDQSCATIDGIARKRLADVDRHIARLGRLRTELQTMIAQCDGNQVGSCHIIEVLADYSHSHCTSGKH